MNRQSRLDAWYWGWCTGTTQRDGMGREEREGFRVGNTCIPVADSCWCMAKPIQYCKVTSNYNKFKKKKAFLSDQCKEIEENNRMGKTRDLFKKIRDTKWIFHAKMGSIKDRNGMDLTEAEDKKRWQEYTERLYKKILMTQITTMVWSLT